MYMKRKRGRKRRKGERKKERDEERKEKGKEGEIELCALRSSTANNFKTI